VQWTTIKEWREKGSSWTKLEGAIGAIDGASTEIYRPQIEQTFIIPFRTGRLIVGADAVYFPISHHTDTRFI
jgi:hypothetical protein